MKCFIDGNCLCIVNNDFINIQESEAVFIKLTTEQIKEIKNLKFKGYRNTYITYSKNFVPLYIIIRSFNPSYIMNKSIFGSVYNIKEYTDFQDESYIYDVFRFSHVTLFKTECGHELYAGWRIMCEKCTNDTYFKRSLSFNDYRVSL